jgi:geranylgeranyl reductase family protein
VIEGDVVVVGAGPAGCAAAIELARAGRDVIMIDKARFPRDKCCGDGLTTGALRLLEHLGLQPATVPSWRVVNAAWVRSPSGRAVCFPLPDREGRLRGEGNGQFAAVAPRQELDAAIVDTARAVGVKVFDGHGLRSVLPSPTDRIVLDVDDLGPVAARYAIGADGMWSPLRKNLGLATSGYLGEWHAFRQYFAGVSGSAAEQLWVWFEPDLLPGYAWSFPLPGGRANVGFGVLRNGARRGSDLKELWPALLARPHIAAALGPQARATAAHKTWPIPARIDRAVLADGRALFVGDAAGACDPMTGEGIGQGLLTGVLAARAITSTGATRANLAAARYERAVAREWLPDHRMAAALSHVLRRERGARGAVRLAGMTDLTRRSFARWLFEDEPRAAALTPARWHRRFLSRPGAYG